MNLGEQFRSEVHTVDPGDSLRAVAERMESQSIGAVVVVDENQVVGIVTDRDLALALALGKVTPECPVRDVMTRPVITIWEDQGVFNATQYMYGHRIRRLPVVNRDNQLVGMVTLDDLFALLAREMFNLSQAVEPALASKGG